MGLKLVKLMRLMGFRINFESPNSAVVLKHAVSKDLGLFRA